MDNVERVQTEARAEIGILGGSGLYELAEVEAGRELVVETPFGSPSDALRVGRLAGRAVAFLARHGRHHRLLPGEINYRANIHAFKQIGVRRILSASAVGSMREAIHPRDVVLPDQFIDRTRARESTFFGGGVAAHVSLEEPVCPELRAELARAGRQLTATVHDGGTYLCIEGPAFSTRAESRLYRSWEVDVIGMTNAQEAKLAREAEICYATLALVTDYDCWHVDAEPVSVEGVVANLKANAALGAGLLAEAVARLPERGDGCGCSDALRGAVITAPEGIDENARRRLAWILGRYLQEG